MEETVVSTDVLDSLMSTISDKKGHQIVAYDVQGSSSLTSYILVVSANNQIHAKALQEEVSQFYKKTSATVDELDPFRVSGKANSGWIVVDMNDILVHIIQEDLREFYGLDEVYQNRSNSVTHHT